MDSSQPKGQNNRPSSADHVLLLCACRTAVLAATRDQLQQLEGQRAAELEVGDSLSSFVFYFYFCIEEQRVGELEFSIF